VEKVCPNFIRKSGGYYYGFRCSVYHDGRYDVYTDGHKLKFERRDHADDKESRDKYVDGICKCDYQKCVWNNR
jgi:hypothetical protein